MPYSIELYETVRSVIREIFLHDRRFEHMYCIRTNRDTRIFMRHLIVCAKRPPYNSELTLQQIAQLIGSPRKSFIQWARNNARRQTEFHRARWFFNEMIRINAEEDREARWKTLAVPSAGQMIEWVSLDEIREAVRVQGPAIKREISAIEVLGWMLDALDTQMSTESSCSFSPLDDDAESTIGEEALDVQNIEEETFLPIGTLGLLDFGAEYEPKKPDA
jgi:hypothetical protein